jgi:hypothetical protein
MQTLIIANILVILFNISLIIFLFYELVKLRREFNEKLPLIENFELKLNELSEAVKFLTKLNLEKLKNNKEKSKIIPFKPEDLDKIKEQLNVSSS